MLKIDLAPIKTFRYSQISNHNFNFLLLTDDLKALHTPFQCKDYLQDIFYCEYTGKKAQIYGLEWVPGMVDMSKPFFKLALMGGKENLKDLMPTMQAFLNIFEDAQGIPRCSFEETEDPTTVVVTFSKDWTANGPLLSTFTTLIRLSGGYKEGDAMDYLKKLQEVRENYNSGKVTQGFPNFMIKDALRIDDFIWKLAAILQGIKVEHSWDAFSNIMYVHNWGLAGYKDYPQVMPKPARKPKKAEATS